MPSQLDSPPAAADTQLLPQERWPFYSQDEIDGVAETLRSGRVNQWTGDRVRAFEAAYEAHIGAGTRAIALANGSVALELALRAFGIGPGDEVIVTPRTFVASAFCVVLTGATPVFADVDRQSGNITPESIEAVLTERTRAVIPVHLGGWPCDMDAICALARERGLLVIEDCAQAHGAQIEGRPVGSFGDAAAFSFCQDKIITTGGEGGLLLMRDEAAYEWAWSFKDHGKSRQKAFDTSAGPGFRWLHDMPGTNWRMLETSAAIGLAQLEKLPAWRTARERRAMIWVDALADVPGLRVPLPAEPLTGAWYRLYAYVEGEPAQAQKHRDAILAAAAERGIRAFSGSCSEVYREAAFADRGIERLPVARELGQASLAFEVHPTLDESRLARRAEVMADIARGVLSTGSVPQR